MKLVIGGYAQGKLQYVKDHMEMDCHQVWDGEIPLKEREYEHQIICNHFHQWVRERIAKGASPEQEIEKFLKEYPKAVIISDEVGNGIVPVDAFEREYRERMGRLLVELARQADEVVRVICGIGQRIK